MLTVAVTGGIGSGKSTVTDLFRAKGVPVIDTDQIARDVVQAPETLSQLIKIFGKTILDLNGKLDRPALRQIAFTNDKNRLKLNNLLHPLIYRHATEQLARTQAPYCLLVIPLLYESQYTYRYDRVLVIDTTPENQLSRSMLRDNSSAAAIQKIIDAQASREDRLSIADDVIDNNGDLDALKPQIDTLHEKYLLLAHTP